MSDLIIHKDGAYNIFGTIADAPHYLSALTLEQLIQVIERDHGQRGVEQLPDRLARAHRTGCSHINNWTLADCIGANRAGPGEAEVPYDEFVAKYLTLAPSSPQGGGLGANGAAPEKEQT